MNRRLIVIGAAGRLGREVVHLAGSRGFDPVTRVVRSPSTEHEHAELGDALAAGGPAVVIDVSSAADAAARVGAAAEAGAPYVQGTTGLDEGTVDAHRAAAERIPVVWAPNFSPGLAVLRDLVARAQGAGSWDLAVLDRHHRAKRDAPSGTARLLAGEMAARGGDPAVASFRLGNVVGEHTVYLTGDDEELVLVHRVGSRAAFAHGALRAAVWAADARPGFHDMAEVLGLGGGA